MAFQKVSKIGRRCDARAHARRAGHRIRLFGQLGEQEIDLVEPIAGEPVLDGAAEVETDHLG
jgi:hypothetical protein